jgi:phosphohistidine phosphatase
MRLILMRHADAGDADPRRWPDDRDRPLTEAGRREHARVAEALRRMGLRCDRLLTSPLVRARETADITARVFGEGLAPEPTELLGDRAEPAAVVAALGRVPAGTLLCVGHEPTLSGLVALLTTRDASARVDMAKSGVAVIDCPDPPAPGRGLLRMHLRPAEIVRLLDEATAPPAAPVPAPPA